MAYKKMRSKISPVIKLFEWQTEKGIKLYTLNFSSAQVSIALDETVEKEDLDDLFWVFNCKSTTADKVIIF